MSTITIDLPDALARELRDDAGRVTEIVELGIREINAGPGLSGPGDVMEFLAKLPSPEDILVLKPSPAYEARIRELVRKSKEDGLTNEEDAEWNRYEYAEHLVRMAKMHAYAKLRPK